MLAMAVKAAWAPRATSTISKGIASSSSLPASILERSRTSFRIASSRSPDLRTTSSRSRWRSDNSSLAMAWVMPRTPFKGVRISWLILAMNWDLAWLAASAAARAARADARLRVSRIAILLRSLSAVVAGTAQAKTAIRKSWVR